MMLQKHTIARCDYRKLGIIDLLEKIVFDSDRKACEEFHNNRKNFRNRNGECQRCIEYIESLKELELIRKNTGSHIADETIDFAFDLTVDKFTRLPQDTKSFGQKNSPKSGTDCRLYYQAYLKRFYALKRSHSFMSEIQTESVAGKLLGSYVMHHFFLSLREAQRHCNPFVNRYEWRIDGGSIYVWFPKSFPGNERKSWLETFVDTPDPYRPGEKERIQDIIDKNLMKGRFVNIETLDVLESSANTKDPALSWAILYGITTQGLAKTVAKEKALNISKQRPAIRSLGEDNLKNLIVEVFESLGTSNCSEEELAKRYALSKATFSRFAGSRWNRQGSDKMSIPDLWLNTAWVISKIPGFAEAAQAAGVWPKVKAIVEMNRDK